MSGPEQSFTVIAVRLHEANSPEATFVGTLMEFVDHAQFTDDSNTTPWRGTTTTAAKIAALEFALAVLRARTAAVETTPT